MSITITASTGTPAETTPEMVIGYETKRKAGTRTHQLLNGGIAVVLRPGSLRSGELRLYYPDEASAFAALNMHARAATFTLTGTARTSVHMRYVIAENGDVTLTLTDSGVFLVTVPYQEIPL